MRAERSALFFECAPAKVSKSAGQCKAGTALAPSVSQQAFKHVTGIRVAGVMPVRVTPMSKIPIDGAGFGD